MSGARLHLTFDERLIQQPVLHGLATRFGVVTNIRRANVEEHVGWVIVDLDGSDRAIADAIAWLAGQGVKVERLDAPSTSV